jgi:hypothetical protein
MMGAVLGNWDEIPETEWDWMIPVWYRAAVQEPDEDLLWR